LRTWSKTAEIILEEGVGLNGTSITCRSKKIIIGANTMIAPNVVIFDSDFHALWPPENRVTNPAFENDADVIIGKNVWIGSGCIIKKGVAIGENTVIAAGSIVTKNIPANVMAAGVPAAVIRNLY
jgi:acetyltransferase-like isoleucine patch superfamily enzyme